MILNFPFDLPCVRYPCGGNDVNMTGMIDIVQELNILLKLSKTEMVGQNEDVSKPCTTVVAVVHSYRPIPHPMLVVQHIPSSKLDKIGAKTDDGIFDEIYQCS